MSPAISCAKCGEALSEAFCEFCYKRLEQKTKDQCRTIEEHESYIQKQEMRILNLKTGNENIRAALEKEIEALKEKIRTGPAEIIKGLEEELATIKTNEGF